MQLEALCFGFMLMHIFLIIQKEKLLVIWRIRMDKRSVQSVTEENENASLANDVSPLSKLTYCAVATIF